MALGRHEYEAQEDHAIYRAQNFKLHLHGTLNDPDVVYFFPKGASCLEGCLWHLIVSFCALVDLPHLPKELDILTIYTDFMGYVLQHTGNCIGQVFGAEIWDELKDEVEIVMTYPNLWKAEQKQVLLNAAILSGWITEPRCRTNLFFVEEAQAAARYCAEHFKGFIVSDTVVLSPWYI